MNPSPACDSCSLAAFFAKPAAAQSKEAASSIKDISGYANNYSDPSHSLVF